MKSIDVRLMWQGRDHHGAVKVWTGILENFGYSLNEITSRYSAVDLEIVGSFAPRYRKVANIVSTIIQGNYPFGTLDFDLKTKGVAWPKRIPKTKLRIWVSGENIRPPAGEDFDLFFSHDRDAFIEGNIYFPYIYQSLGIFGQLDSNKISIRYKPENFLRSRQLNSKDKFVCVFMSNPTSVRISAIKELSKYGQVDVFGNAMKARVKDKFEAGKEYKYMLAFENDLYPGYVTEKLPEAFASGAVPLYWGDLGNYDFLNQNCFINLCNFKSVKDFSYHVAQIDESQYAKIHAEPLLNKLPNIKSVVKILSNL